MVEFLSVFCSSFENMVHIVNALCIDVENWRIDGLSKIRRVVTTSSFAWHCCITNLVVNNDMDGTSYGIVFKILHLKGFVDNSLSSECSVSVNQNRYNFVPILSVAVSVEDMVFGSDSSHYYWVHAFKMRWIC